MTLTAEELRQRLVRNIDEALAGPDAEDFSRPPLYSSRGAALARGTAARKLGCAVDIVAPGQQSCPYHLHHAQEEMFVILEGAGSLRVAGALVPVKAGDVIFIPPGKDYPHHLLNTSGAPLKYLSVSTMDKPELCEYPDSGKVSAWAEGVRVSHRPESSLDYWDGEP
jgi:uncharacterized cupin superfamily protein